MPHLAPTPTLTLLLTLLLSLPPASAHLPRPGVKTGDARWVRLSVNMLTTPPSTLAPLLDRAKSAGANAVLFSDVKLLAWWFRPPGPEWLRNVHAVRDAVRKRRMRFLIEGEGLGYCHAPLAYDVNLAAGYPLRDVRLRVSRNGRKLLPDERVTIPNPSFDVVGARGPHSAADWSYQDDPGVVTFLDRAVKHSGAASLRLQARRGAKARIFSRPIRVSPYHQYTFSAYMRADALTASFTAILIRASVNDADLTSQHLSLPAGRDRAYFQSARRLSTRGLGRGGWVQQRLAFNSLMYDRVYVVLGVWGGVSGAMWWDDVKMMSTPLLNVLRRDALPLQLRVASSGVVLREGRQYRKVVDEGLGKVLSYDGVYDTYHDSPTVRLRRGKAGVSSGDIVLLSGYHTMVTTSGQVGCSWSDELLKFVIEKTYIENEFEFSPDGFMLGHNEIRTGGWEPAEVAEGDSGKALAAFLRWEVETVRRITLERPYLYMWSDMIDVHHNAVKGYYQVRGSLKTAWKGVSPSKVAVVNWNGNFGASESYRFFDEKGYTQIAAAFYDEGVAKNRRKWLTTFGGRKSAGSMYTTWSDDFSKLKAFAAEWW